MRLVGLKDNNNSGLSSLDTADLLTTCGIVDGPLHDFFMICGQVLRADTLT